MTLYQVQPCVRRDLQAICAAHELETTSQSALLLKNGGCKLGREGLQSALSSGAHLQTAVGSRRSGCPARAGAAASTISPPALT